MNLKDRQGAKKTSARAQGEGNNSTTNAQYQCVPDILKSSPPSTSKKILQPGVYSALSFPPTAKNAAPTLRKEAVHSVTLFYNSKAVSTLSAVESTLRAFVANPKMRTMALKAMDKSSRRQVCSLAECFGIGTEIQGKKKTGRYVNLVRTKRTGLSIDEAKIRQMVPVNGEDNVYLLLLIRLN
jgi:hypothetical protein